MRPRRRFVCLRSPTHASPTAIRSSRTMRSRLDPVRSSRSKQRNRGSLMFSAVLCMDSFAWITNEHTHTHINTYTHCQTLLQQNIMHKKRFHVRQGPTEATQKQPCAGSASNWAGRPWSHLPMQKQQQSPKNTHSHNQNNVRIHTPLPLASI